jgi:hypothetical protein
MGRGTLVATGVVDELGSGGWLNVGGREDDAVELKSPSATAAGGRGGREDALAAGDAAISVSFARWVAKYAAAPAASTTATPPATRIPAIPAGDIERRTGLSGGAVSTMGPADEGGIATAD